VPFTLVGLTLGVTLLVRLPRDATVLALGVFVCVYGLYVIFRRGPARPLSRLWAAPAGVLGGVIGARFGIGGPPHVVYITGRLPDPAVQRASTSTRCPPRTRSNDPLGQRSRWPTVILSRSFSAPGLYGDRPFDELTSDQLTPERELLSSGFGVTVMRSLRQ
jgi:Sulfite exporter TauE/SafE